jgi:hypothetical protein
MPKDGGGPTSKERVSLKKFLETASEDAKKRYSEVESCMKEQKLEIRDDSRLVQAYLDDVLGKEWNPEKIKNELCVTHYLYNYTEYGNYSSKMFPLIAKFFHDKLNMPWSVAWGHSKKHIIPMLKYVATEQEGGIPTTWPWLEATEVVTEIPE